MGQDTVGSCNISPNTLYERGHMVSYNYQENLGGNYTKILGLQFVLLEFEQFGHHILSRIPTRRVNQRTRWDDEPFSNLVLKAPFRYS
jgi:hypothetical protein